MYLPMPTANVELCCLMQAFPDWLQAQIDAREWSKADFSRRSGIDPGTVSNVLNGMRKAGPEFCRAAAATLGMPEAVVFYRAGLITQDPEDPTQELDPLALEILQMVANRPDAEQAAIVATVRALVENFDRGKREQSGRTNSVAGGADNS